MDKFFGITAQGSTLGREFMAGVTTFLAMAYILFVNAFILADAGMDPDAVFVATALAGATGCAIMGLWAHYPIGLAPGMGLNAFFAYTVVLGICDPRLRDGNRHATDLQYRHRPCNGFRALPADHGFPRKVARGRSDHIHAIRRVPHLFRVRDLSNGTI